MTLSNELVNAMLDAMTYGPKRVVDPVFAMFREEYENQKAEEPSLMLKPATPT